MFKKLSITACSLFLIANIAHADENIFGAVTVDESAPLSLPSEKSVEPLSIPINNIDSNKVVKPEEDDAKLQEAILKIDSAQVDIQNELNAIEIKLADLENREKLLRAEKKIIKTKLKKVRKRFKDLDKAKINLKKNMNDLQVSE